MKKLLTVVILCACMVDSEEGYAQIRCYSNPYNDYATCEGKGIAPYIGESRHEIEQRKRTSRETGKIFNNPEQRDTKQDRTIPYWRRDSSYCYPGIPCN